MEALLGSVAHGGSPLALPWGSSACSVQSRGEACYRDRHVHCNSSYCCSQGCCFGWRYITEPFKIVPPFYTLLFRYFSAAYLTFFFFWRRKGIHELKSCCSTTDTFKVLKERMFILKWCLENAGNKSQEVVNPHWKLFIFIVYQTFYSLILQNHKQPIWHYIYLWSSWSTLPLSLNSEGNFCQYNWKLGLDDIAQNYIKIKFVLLFSPINIDYYYYYCY